MRSKYVWVLLVVALAATLVVTGCNLGKKKEKTEPITVTETTTTPGGEAPATEVTLPEQPVYEPTKLDDLKMLDSCLGAAAETLGWDNVFCYGTLDKSVGLFTELQPAYAPGTADRTFIDQSITDLTNIMTWLDEKISKGEGIDPNSADAKAKKKQIRDIRARVQAMITGPAPAGKIPEWKGDLMKKKWHERGELMKKKWAERGK